MKNVLEILKFISREQWVFDEISGKSFISYRIYVIMW